MLSLWCNAGARAADPHTLLRALAFASQLAIYDTEAGLGLLTRLMDLLWPEDAGPEVVRQQAQRGWLPQGAPAAAAAAAAAQPVLPPIPPGDPLTWKVSELRAVLRAGGW